MHQNFTYTDIADRYLKGQLSESERLAFEEKMQQDPLLANEMSLQQEIYQALSETRKLALKHRLNQVSIHHSPWAPWIGLKTAAVVGTLFLAGAGYYYFDLSVASAEEDSSFSSTSVTYPKAYTLDHSAKGALKTKESVPAVSPPSEVTAQENITKTAPSKRTFSTPTIVRPDVISEFDEEALSVNYDDFNVPEKQMLQGSHYQEEDVAIEALLDSDYDFHYQFYDNKLYLHGDFRGMPYKIIALNTEADKKLFLEFHNDYYRIGEHREAVPLVKIEDSTLINSLKNLGQTD